MRGTPRIAEAVAGARDTAEVSMLGVAVRDASEQNCTVHCGDLGGRSKRAAVTVARSTAENFVALASEQYNVCIIARHTADN
jgi:hypothetical protein